jgi:hypothetical protein
MQSIILIPVVFLFFSFLMIWIIIGSRGAWWGKLLLMIIALAISVEIYVSLDSYRGHPLEVTYDQMPNSAWLLWSYVDEPDKTTNNPGGIYLLLRPRGDNPVKGLLSYFVPNVTAIRLYKLPYSRESHKEEQDLQKKIKDKLEQHDNDPLLIGFKKPRRVAGGSDTNGEGEFYELPEVKRIPKPN